LSRQTIPGDEATAICQPITAMDIIALQRRRLAQKDRPFPQCETCALWRQHVATQPQAAICLAVPPSPVVVNGEVIMAYSSPPSTYGCRLHREIKYKRQKPGGKR